MARPKLSDIPTETLVKELQRRQAKAEQLRIERERLDKEIEELAGAESVTGVMSAKPAGRKPRGRAKAARTARGGAKPLSQYMLEVLAGKPKGLSLPEFEKAVKAAGYPTTAKSIYNPMLKVIRKDSRFKKLARGVYALKAGAKVTPVKAAKASGKPAKATAKKTAKRKKYDVTAEQFVLDLVKGGGATTAEINKAWAQAGRTGRADNTLNKMLKAGKLKRENLKGQRGSKYTAA